MESKQTAVEWLDSNLIHTPYTQEDFKYNYETFDRAKAMEDESKFTLEDMILYALWLQKADTVEKAEQWFGFTNQDMLRYWLENHRGKEF